MKQTLTIVLFLIASVWSYAQTTADFENFDLEPGEALNGSAGSGGFSSGNLFLPNSYNPDFNAWSGWAVSATTDVTTPGFMNDLSAITGGGYNSTAYAVSFASPQSVIVLQGAAAGGVVEGFYVTNGTYPYLSMLEGDGFAKKFGGESGDDPDFFLLTIKKYLGGELGTDSVNFYLADYRFEDNSQDYIVEEWTYVDLSTLGNADSLQFTMSSTDNSMFGMNTPAYFCMDDLTTTDMPVSTQHTELPAAGLNVFPNPASDTWHVQWESDQEAEARLMNVNGQVLQTFRLLPGTNAIEALTLPAGIYVLQVQSANGYLAKTLFKTNS
ncbi:MAG: DUF4465 domain-containing protein [bacterium]|nr:DUF4465 domain-containing protein [bacterium]